MAVIAALLVGVCCGQSNADEPRDFDSRSEVEALKNRLRYVEKLLGASQNSVSFDPKTTVPPAPTPEGGHSPPGVGSVAAGEKPARPDSGRSGNLSTLPRPFEEEYPSLNWSGFLQLDTGWVSQSQKNKDAVGDISAQTGLRRVRLRVDGFLREDAEYVIDLDFAADGHPSFRNVALTFSDVPEVQNLILGYFKTPFGMDAMTGGRELLMLERQLPFAFAPFRQTGVGVFGTDECQYTTYNFAVFGFPTDRFGVTTANNGGASFASRVTRLLVDDGRRNRLMHVGAGYSIGDPADNIIRYRIQPGFFVGDPAGGEPTSPTIVDTGRIPARLFHLFNLEWAMTMGALQMQSEIRWSIVDQIGGPTLGFSGGYFQAGYLLTGERPNYDRRKAIFRRIVPLREFKLGDGGGAVQLTAGYSFIDVTDKNIQGGMSQQFILGLNWYLHKHTKFVLNIAPVTLDHHSNGSSGAIVASARAQVDF